MTTPIIITFLVLAVIVGLMVYFATRSSSSIVTTYVDPLPISSEPKPISDPIQDPTPVNKQTNPTNPES